MSCQMMMVSPWQAQQISAQLRGMQNTLCKAKDRQSAIQVDAQNQIIIPFRKRRFIISIFGLPMPCIKIAFDNGNRNSAVYCWRYTETSHTCARWELQGFWFYRGRDTRIWGHAQLKAPPRWTIRQHAQLDLGMTSDDGKDIARSLLLLRFTFLSSLTRFGLHPRIIIKYRRSLPMRSGSGE